MSTNRRSSQAGGYGDRDRDRDFRNRDRDTETALVSASASRRRKSSGTNYDTHASTTTTTTTKDVSVSESGTGAGTGTAGEDIGRPAVKRVRTLNATEDDTRRGKRMMGMILGTLTQFKRQQAAPRTTPSAAAAAAAASASKPAASAKPSTADKPSDQPSASDKSPISDRSSTKPSASERPSDKPSASDKPSTSERPSDKTAAPISTTSTATKSTTATRDDGERGAGTNGTGAGDAISSGGASVKDTAATAAAKEILEDSGVASREAVQERVRDKMRREREMNEDTAKRESAEREARLRATLLKQIAGKSSVPRRRGVITTATSAARAGRWENGYLLTETLPRLRYMPKTMNGATRRKFERQSENYLDQKPIPTRNNTTTTSARDSEQPAPSSKTISATTQEEEGGVPSAEAVAKAEAEAARELEDAMDMDDAADDHGAGITRRPAGDGDFAERRRSRDDGEVSTKATAVVSGSCSVTVSEGVAMED
ncbi:hypothetical protein BGX29_001974 [Mortierella sp. GBA35]|nr:hypothetical protein BGX29_001974 [Mortierella sp. GBA35]